MLLGCSPSKWCAKFIFFFFFRCLSKSQWHKKRPWVSWLSSWATVFQPWVWAGFLAPQGSAAQPSALQRCTDSKPIGLALRCRRALWPLHHPKDQQHLLRQQVLLRRMPTVFIPSYQYLVWCNFLEMGHYSPLNQEFCSTIQISPGAKTHPFWNITSWVFLV